MECPKCHTSASDDAPAEVLRAKFYPHKIEGYYTCLECSRRFHAKTGTIVS